ncbi:MAG: hypothetical protein MOB07_22750 [Acidobacteria bacterium]|nr:hypothetical protein [Acidobacteriota bacterium]
MKKMRLLCCFIIALSPLSTRTAPSASGQDAMDQRVEIINIPELLREAETRSCQILQERAPQFENYTYKTRRVTREKERDGKVKEESEFHENYPYAWGISIKRRRNISVLIEKNGKPVAPEKIEKERLKVGKNLERYDKEPRQPRQIDCSEYGVAFRRINPFGNGPIVGLTVSEVIEQCEFDDPRNEKIEGRETVSLRFRPRPGSIFSEKSKFLPQFEGRIWIDAADRMICRLAAYPRGTEFEQMTSDYLLENAALAFAHTKTKEGVWMARYFRVNGLKYHGSLLWHTQDFLYEYFDFRYFKTDSEKEKIIAPDKKD